MIVTQKTLNRHVLTDIQVLLATSINTDFKCVHVAPWLTRVFDVRSGSVTATAVSAAAAAADAEPAVSPPDAAAA